MTNSAGSRRKRPRRSTAASQKLQRLRERNAEQQAEVERRKTADDKALQDYVDAGDAVVRIEADRDRRLADLDAARDRVLVEAAVAAGPIRERQARAALSLHVKGRSVPGRTVAEVAELLELSQKATRALIQQGRRAARTKGDESSATGPGGDGARRGLDAGFNEADRDLGRAMPDGSAERAS